MSIVLDISNFSPSRQSSFRRKALLSQREGYFWRLEQGYVRSLTWDEDGQVSVLGLWGPRDWVAPPLRQLPVFHWECLTPVLARLQSTQDDYPSSLLRQQALRTETMLSWFQNRQVNRRLQQALVWLSQEFGSSIEGGRIINIPLTHQELADLIGSTRVTVTRLLQELKATERIAYHQRFLVLKYDEFNTIAS